MARTADGAPRTVDVPPERLPRWLDRFSERHGAVDSAPGPDTVELTAADGARVVATVPFPPLAVRADLPYAGLVEHARATRRVGVLLVRRGGYAAGVFEGDRLTSSKVGSRYVQGGTKAGGWSQQRFARRREQQASKAFAAAADVAVRILVPAAGDLDALVCGGDRRAVDTVLADRRLAGLVPLVVSPLYPVPDPRQRVLDGMPARFRATRLTVTDP
ncbi:MAG: acVLRF1 family peptidyl-tRNA hydrolase [Streptosporangiales bacterium]